MCSRPVFRTRAEKAPVFLSVGAQGYVSRRIRSLAAGFEAFAQRRHGCRGGEKVRTTSPAVNAISVLVKIPAFYLFIDVTFRLVGVRRQLHLEV